MIYDAFCRKSGAATERPARLARRLGWPAAVPVVGAALASCLLLALSGCGCDDPNTMPLAQASDFHDIVARADRPVLVYLYKGG